MKKDFDLSQALKDLHIDRPVLRVDRLPDGRYRLHLYGGGTVDWPPAAVPAAPRTPHPARKKP